jgi:hypothetical protein
MVHHNHVAITELKELGGSRAAALEIPQEEALIEPDGGPRGGVDRAQWAEGHGPSDSSITVMFLSLPLTTSNITSMPHTVHYHSGAFKASCVVVPCVRLNH